MMIKKILKDMGIVLLVGGIFTLGLIFFTPYPATGLIHTLFAQGGPATAPDDLDKRLATIDNYNDLTYISLIEENQYDLARPKTNEKVPVIIWVHGGAFVGGDRKDNRIYTQMIASEGYAVANMNYSLAPTSKYPSPLIQLGDMYETLEKNAEKYHLDMSQVYFAGDSAGGQITMQFLNIQMDKNYSKKLGLPQVVPAETIKGGLLFCTPFSLKDLSDLGDSKVINYFVKNIGWSYTGDRQWLTSEKVKDADLLTVTKEKMPPLFITDGNQFSFEEQGKKFSEKMKSQGTNVTSVFYPIKTEELMHEYQFDLTSKSSQETYEKLIGFLKENSV